MNLLHRHIFWGVLGTCGASVGLWAFLLLLGNVLRDLLGYVLVGQIDGATFLKLVGLLLPYVVGYALPTGVLTGVLLVLGRMSAEREITAMRAAGLSLAYVARPVYLLAGLATLLALGIHFDYMPRARSAYKQLFSEAVQKNPLNFIVPRTFVHEFSGLVVYAGEREDYALRDVWLWQLDEQGRTERFTKAKSGRIEFDAATNQISLVLEQASAAMLNRDDPEDYSRPPVTMAAGSVPLDYDLSKIFGLGTVQRKLAWMTIGELRHELAVAPDEAMRLKISYTIHEKASYAMTVLAFTFIAIPLGIRVSRKETSANLGVALGLVMIYYISNVAIGWLDRFPAARADLLLWVPVIAFMVIGLWLMRRVERA